MGKTSIEWTATQRPDGTWVPGYTFNPWWGCTKVSAGCTHCYADTLSTRWGYDIWGPKAKRRFFGDPHWQEPIRWNRDAERDGIRRRVFCASMADVFEQHLVPEVNVQMNVARARLWELIEQTSMLDWLLLTKRPENIRRMVWLSWLQEPPPNVWYGTSTENQEQADARIPELLQVPARVRFLSAEPLLGPIDLDLFDSMIVDERDPAFGGPGYGRPDKKRPNKIHWVITGGESGFGARPLNPDWVRSLRDQCVAAGVAFFHKQNGGRVAKLGGRLLDGRTWDQFPVVEVPA